MREKRLVILKGYFSQKTKTKSVIVYSPSCHSKPVWLFFFFLRNTKEDILKNFVLTSLGQKQVLLCSTEERNSGLELNGDRIFHFWLNCPCECTCRAGLSETDSSCMQFLWAIKSNVQLITVFRRCRLIFSNFNVFILTLKMWINQKQPNKTRVCNSIQESWYHYTGKISFLFQSEK